MGKAVRCDSTSEMKTNPPYGWMKFLKFLTDFEDFFWAIFPVNKNLTALAEAGNSCPVGCLLRPCRLCKSWWRGDVLYLQHAKASGCQTAGGLVQRFGAVLTTTIAWITADPVAAPWHYPYALMQSSLCVHPCRRKENKHFLPLRRCSGL